MEIKYVPEGFREGEDETAVKPVDVTIGQESVRFTVNKGTKEPNVTYSISKTDLKDIIGSLI